MGSDFFGAVFKDCSLSGGSFSYASFSESLWENCRAEGVGFRDAGFSEARFKNVSLDRADFSSADFFRASLKGTDFSRCETGGILLSEGLSELKGTFVSPLQACALVRLLGIGVRTGTEKEPPPKKTTPFR